MKKTVPALAALSIGAAVPAFAATSTAEPAAQSSSAGTDSLDYASDAPEDGFVDDDGLYARPGIDEIVAQAKALGVLDEAELAAYRDAETRIAALEEEAADLVILDISMPGSDGFEICRRLREISPVPVMMLTARDTDSDMIDSIMLGADDFLAKPIRSAQLQTRVHALLRRSRMDSTLRPLSFGPLRLDAASQQVLFDGAELSLTPTEFEVCSRLIRAAGSLVTRRTFMREVWGYEVEAPSRTLDETIRRIRKTLDAASSTVRIENKWGRGYRLALDGAGKGEGA